MRSSQLLASALALTSFAAAWQPFDEFDGLVSGISGTSDAIFRRQDDEQQAETSQAQESAQPESTAQSDQPEETGATSARGTQRGSATITGDATQTGSNTDSPVTTGFDPRLPAGGLSMVTPNAFSGPQFYKVGDNVTFAWNYTSLSVTPSFIDILASCSKNAGTYTIAVNHSAESTSIVWDTRASQTLQFLTETYTLIVYDAESSITAAARPGYLGSWAGLTFGMYTPQPYVPLDEFQCPTCNRNAGGSLSAHEAQTLSLVLGMATVTILSFTWFGAGFGAFAF